MQRRAIDGANAQIFAAHLLLHHSLMMDTDTVGVCSDLTQLMTRVTKCLEIDYNPTRNVQGDVDHLLCFYGLLTHFPLLKRIVINLWQPWRTYSYFSMGLDTTQLGLINNDSREYVSRDYIKIAWIQNNKSPSLPYNFDKRSSVREREKHSR
jgi:hypothetical protein